MSAASADAVAAQGIDSTWTMIGGILVMLMQAGFAMVEAGAVQRKNQQAILMKNLLDACVGAMAWWAVGYGFAFGETKSKFIGGNLFFAQHKDYEVTSDTFHYLYWFFQWAFCATAATIVSGAVAERVKLSGYTIFMVVMTSFIYPIVVHWTWGGGWLSDGDDGMYSDFAGSGIVHMCGGVAALVGAAVIGPRTGRWDPDKAEDFMPGNISMVVLGTFILWFGWYGFNCGSTVSMTPGENANAAALVAMTTTLSAGTGGIVVFSIKLAQTGQYDMSGLSNGILAGLVSITAPCASVYGWSAILIGAIGGLVYTGSSALVKMLKIDDPIDAFSVHGACGAWGVLAVAFFDGENGIFYGGADAGKLLGWQICGIVVIALWTGVLSAATFVALRLGGLLRLAEADEMAGGDAHFQQKEFPIVPTKIIP